MNTSNTKTPRVMKFIAKKRKSFLVEDGQHLAIIAGAVETESSSPEFKEGTPQIEVDFQLKDGRKIKAWYNLRGYKKDEDGNYITDKLGNRIVDEENTDKAQEIFAGVAADAGLSDGEEFSLEDLAGLEVGINVETNERGNKRVTYTLPAGSVEVEG